MELDRRICDRARLARDSRFDGLFFIGVLSTGIYCRPVCPARAPKEENIAYFPTAAAAAEAGLRPCLRCRPETAPGSPAWNGTSATVSRALQLIRRGTFNADGIEDLAARLGVGGRHLRRLFQTHLGASPKALVTTQKTLFAKQLLDETRLSIAQIAFAAGFGSIRRFNAAFQKIYGRTPSSLRRRKLRPGDDAGSTVPCELTLAYRPPFDWPAMLSFFESRAIAGVEKVVHGAYHRTVRLDRSRGWISVIPVADAPALRLIAVIDDPRDLIHVVARVRRMFDLDANTAAIHEVLAVDPVLRPILRRRPGLRLPGAWDPFEVAVRAVVGQQISVRGARTIAGRIVEQAGPPVTGDTLPGLTRYFPTARELSAGSLYGIGMPTRRKDTLAALSRAVASGEIAWEVPGSLEAFVRRLTRLPGIGDWTAQVIAMRALGEPDAFPAADLGIARALSRDGPGLTRRQINERAENWRPWRAYAAICLWHAGRE